MLLKVSILMIVGINAFIYMVVARLVHFTLPDKSIWGIRGIKLTTLFVGLDILSFIVQLGGGSMLSNNDHPDIAQIGMKVYVAGIGVQLAFVVIFGGMTIWYYVLVHRLRRGQMGMLRYLVWVMLLVLALIVVSLHLHCCLAPPVLTNTLDSNRLSSGRIRSWSQRKQPTDYQRNLPACFGCFPNGPCLDAPEPSSSRSCPARAGQ